MKYATSYTAATTLASGDIFQIVQSGVDKKCSMSTMLAYIGSNSTAFTTTSTFNTFVSGTFNTHASTHILGGSNELDVAKTKVSNLTVNVTPDSSWTSGGSSSHLGAYLKAIDTRLNTTALGLSAHNALHTENGTDEIRGLYLDGTGISVTNYTPATWGVGTTTTSIGGHFSGIDTQFGSVTTALGLKAPLANPTFTGTVIIPDLSITDDSSKAANTKFVQDVKDDLVAGASSRYNTLKKLETAIVGGLSAKASTDHSDSHMYGGTDAILGNRTYGADYIPDNYTRTAYYLGGTVYELGCHFKGIDDVLGTLLDDRKYNQSYDDNYDVTISTLNTWENITISNSFYNNGFTNHTTYITVNQNGKYHMNYTVSGQLSSATDQYQVSLSVNDSPLNSVYVKGSSQFCASNSRIADLETGDTIAIVVKNVNSTAGLHVWSANLTVTQV